MQTTHHLIVYLLSIVLTICFCLQIIICVYQIIICKSRGFCVATYVFVCEYVWRVHNILAKPQARESESRKLVNVD